MSKIDGYQIEKDAKRIWDTDADTRAEFSSYDTFLAYKKAKANGQVQMAKGRVQSELK